MDKKDKLLSVSLDLLSISKDCLLHNEDFSDIDVLNTLIINGISKQSLGNASHISDYFKNSSDYKKFFRWLSEELHVDYVSDSGKVDYPEVLKTNCFIIPSDMTVLEFYDSIRNSIAHKNILNHNGKYIFFMSYSGKGYKSIDAAWKNFTKILIVVDALDDIANYGRALQKYLQIAPKFSH